MIGFILNCAMLYLFATFGNFLFGIIGGTIFAIAYAYMWLIALINT